MQDQDLRIVCKLLYKLACELQSARAESIPWEISIEEGKKGIWFVDDFYVLGVKDLF